MSLFNKKKPKNKYSERRAVSFSREVRPARKVKFKPGALLGLFSAATIATICLVLFVTVAAGLIFVYRWSTTSSYFALKEIDVTGINNLSYTEVMNQADIKNGMNSLALSLDVLEAKLLQNPWVAGVSVKRSLPDGITITIKEREPYYWTLKDGRMHYADQNGNTIAQVNSDKFLALPILEVGPDSAETAKTLDSAIAQIQHVINILPEELHNPALYRISQARGVEVHFEGSQLKLLFGLEDMEGNIERMMLVLNDLKKRGELASAKEIRAHNGKVWVVI